MGDFNRLSFKKNFLNCMMKNVVVFPTREGVHLDQIWTNETVDLTVSELCKLSDHSGILSRPTIANKHFKKKVVKRHKIRVLDHDKLKCNFETTDWSVLLQGCSLDEKNDVVSSYIKFCYDEASTFEMVESIDDEFISNAVVKHARRKRSKCFKDKDKTNFDYWDSVLKEETARITGLFLNKMKRLYKSKEYWNNIKSIAIKICKVIIPRALMLMF